ncbi:MAG: hypothetical protein QOF63_1598 [Thermoanaerobaculia bacterium]|jgi:hypothetical protein|nr:hypothetical protein [Thermoanaerobaculia bacterium]
MQFVAKFHRALISLERFDSEYVRPRVGTTDNHPPREFAIVTTYLRSLAHVRTLIDLNDGRHFQATSIVARALFELAVEIPLIEKVEDGPEKHRIFSDVERLRAAQQIVAFHATGNVQEPLDHLWLHETFIANNAGASKTRLGQYGRPTRSRTIGLR